MRTKTWFFFVALLILVFFAGRASADKPKRAGSYGALAIPKYESPKWDPIVSKLLTQRAHQLAQEQARRAQIEAAQRAQAAEQAKRTQAAQTPIQTAVKAPSAPVSGDAKAFIYMHESGNNPAARNSAGCLGLGQACPGSKLLAVCPSLDYACEDQFFTAYMLGRYGSWENARAFWISHSWW